MPARIQVQLQQKFPEQWWLGVDEVATVLGAASRGGKQAIRERMQNGTYPGAQKHGGRWKLPLLDLADILEPTPAVRFDSGFASATKPGSGRGPDNTI